MVVEIWLVLTLAAPGLPPKRELLGPYPTRTLCVMIWEMRTDQWIKKHPDGITKAFCGTKAEIGLLEV